MQAPISGTIILCPKKGMEGRGEAGRRGTRGETRGRRGREARERKEGRSSIFLSFFLKAGTAHTGPCGDRTGDLGVFSTRL